jgi:hypothetical protein
VALAGAGGVIALGVLMGEFIFNSSISATFAVTRHLSLEFMVGAVVLGAIWYAVAWRVNARKGVNLGLAYREIPPE